MAREVIGWGKRVKRGIRVKEEKEGKSFFVTSLFLAGFAASDSAIFVTFVSFVHFVLRVRRRNLNYRSALYEGNTNNRDARLLTHNS